MLESRLLHNVGIGLGHTGLTSLESGLLHAIWIRLRHSWLHRLESRLIHSWLHARLNFACFTKARLHDWVASYLILGLYHVLWLGVIKSSITRCRSLVPIQNLSHRLALRLSHRLALRLSHRLSSRLNHGLCILINHLSRYESLSARINCPLSVSRDNHWEENAGHFCV